MRKISKKVLILLNLYNKLIVIQLKVGFNRCINALKNNNWYQNHRLEGIFSGIYIFCLLFNLLFFGKKYIFLPKKFINTKQNVLYS